MGIGDCNEWQCCLQCEAVVGSHRIAAIFCLPRPCLPSPLLYQFSAHSFLPSFLPSFSHSFVRFHALHLHWRLHFFVQWQFGEDDDDEAVDLLLAEESDEDQDKQALAEVEHAGEVVEILVDSSDEQTDARLHAEELETSSESDDDSQTNANACRSNKAGDESDVRYVSGA